MTHSSSLNLLLTLFVTTVCTSCAAPARNLSLPLRAAVEPLSEGPASIASGLVGWQPSQNAVPRLASSERPAGTSRDELRDSAQPKPGELHEARDGLSLEDLQRLARENNPSLQQAAWNIDRACGVHTQVGRPPNPTVGFQGAEMGNNGRAGQLGPYFQQAIVLGGKLGLNQEVAEQSVQSAVWQAQAQQLRVLNDVAISYYQALGAQRRLEVAAQLEEIASQGVSTANDLFAAKQGSKPDILQAEIQLTKVRITRRNAQFAFDAAWGRLAALVGQPSLAPARLHGELTRPAVDREFESSFAALMANSPEIQSALARVHRAQALLRRQQVQPVPNLLTQVGVAHDYGTGNAIANLQVGLPLPVFNRNLGNVAVAHAEYHQAWQNVDRLKLDLRARLAEAFRQYAQARNEVQLIEQNILPHADENRSLTEEAYELGEFDFLRVLTARRTYFESNLRYVAALTNLRMADTLIAGLLLTGGLAAPAGFDSDLGLRDQALTGE